MHVDIGFQRHIGHIGNVATPSARHAMKKAEPKHEPWLESAASPTRSQVPLQKTQKLTDLPEKTVWVGFHL